MARIEGLMAEIESFFGGRTSSISAIYSLKKYFYFVGGFVGLVAGFLLRESAAFLIVALVVSAAAYLYAETYLLKIDHEFFSSPGRSKREIFDKYYAGEVSQNLSLRMTEPEELVSNSRLSVEQNRELFQQRLAVELDHEFRRSDWKFFVAESLYFQRR